MVRLANFWRRISIYFKVLTGILLITFGSASLALAQTEDTTRTPREFPQERNSEQSRDSNATPYQMDILRSDIERYQLNDYGSSHRFYRQLQYRTPEDFLMSEEEGYNRYGAKWERKINEDLLTILRATFKEDSEIMKIWKRIAPFLSFGIWEPYEVPITRVDYPEKVPVETVEEE
ncbi:MAG: hypothetical protein R3220_01400 [Balneolaceae bacterium]|nr:hypothetical protein [Balneolaceae bacterium]